MREERLEESSRSQGPRDDRDIRHILDVIADLQIKGGVGGIGRDRILVVLLPPPADPERRQQINRQLNDIVPELLTRYDAGGALAPSYELTGQGWLQTSVASRVLDIIKAFLEAFRSHVTKGNCTQRLDWTELVAQGLADSDYHLTCIIARCFELQNGATSQTWDGKNAPRASFEFPIDIDDLLDVVNPDDLVARRQRVPYERLHARKVISGEITGHVRRAVEYIYKSFFATGSWPPSRTLHVELAQAGISLERVASGRFVRGCDIYTEGAQTMLTLAGLLIPAEAEDDRQLVVKVLRFVGEYARAHPEERVINPLVVMNHLEIDEDDITYVAKMLQAQGSAYVNSGSGTFDIARMHFYVSPDFISHADANELWDIVLNEEIQLRRWQARGLDGAVFQPSVPTVEIAEMDATAPMGQGPADLRATVVSTNPRVDIGILTIRDDEFRAVLDAFPAKAGVFRGAHREYTLRKADASNGQQYTVAVLRQLEQGNGEAQNAARDCIMDLSPTLILVVGIAGGLPSSEARLGDVVVSTRIHDFTVGAKKHGEPATYSATGGPIEKALAAAVANLRGKEDQLGDWTSGLPAAPSVSWTKKGQLYGPKEWRKQLRDRLQQHYGESVTPRRPDYRDGPIGSSDRLIKDPKELFPWITNARHLLAVEMESGGVFRAALGSCPMLAIRGISDIVGLVRSDAWTKYACASAAAFARAFLRTQPIEPAASSVSADPS